MGTFSKILAAGFRLGWILAEPALVARLMPLKQDWGTNPFVCRVAAAYLGEHMDEHIARLIGVYREKRDTMLAGLEAGLGREASWTRPEGGFFVWVRLPAGTDPDRLRALAAERQVSYVAGPAFYPADDGAGAEHLRLAFSFADVPGIAEGTVRLAEAIRLAR
jgi:2-aminoadipate transaminase